MLLHRGLACFFDVYTIPVFCYQETMAYETIRFHPGPRMSTIVLDRPPLNVINIQMMGELNRAWVEVEELGAPLVVISGEGERAFSAGVDIADHKPERVVAMLEGFHATLRRIYKSDCISIAVIHGHTMGGASELAMACDFVIASDDLTLAHPEIDVGCYPPVAATLLPSKVGMHRASEIVLLGQSLSADEAMGLGLVNEVVPADQLDAAIDRWAERILSRSTAVLSVAKKALRAGEGDTFDARLTQVEHLYLHRLAHTEDMREGVDAFLEKRPPEWKHR